MSSSTPGGFSRNKTCHTAESANANIKTCFGKLGVVKSSRIANKYENPAAISEIMNARPPRSPKLREQIVRASSRMPPKANSLTAGPRVTALPYDDALDRGPAPILQTTLPFAELAPAPAPVPERAGRGLRQHR